jgi:hypothetical protein
MGGVVNQLICSTAADNFLSTAAWASIVVVITTKVTGVGGW